MELVVSFALAACGRLILGCAVDPKLGEQTGCQVFAIVGSVRWTAAVGTGVSTSFCL